MDQAGYIYKKVQHDSILNVEMIKQEIEDNKLDNGNNNEGEENPYQI